MRKLLFLICCVVISLSFHTQIVFAGEVVTTKNLTIKDVQTAILSGSLSIYNRRGLWGLSSMAPNSLKILGVHQEGNTATVYCPFNTKEGSQIIGRVGLVRFNSGKWFSHRDGTYLEK